MQAVFTASHHVVAPPKKVQQASRSVTVTRLCHPLASIACVKHCISLVQNCIVCNYVYSSMCLCII